jgi:hypothetical protein
MRQKHEQILAVLKLLETGPKTLKDIAVAMNATKDRVRAWMYDLEHMGAVRSTFQQSGYRGLASRVRVIHLVDKKKYQMKERKPTVCKIKETFENGSYPIPKGGTIHRFLDQPERARPLRKMNYGWMGYQSGLEAA